MSSTLTPLLASDAVPMGTLHERYGSLLELVRRLIGVVPNCDPYLEIWSPGFRTYNVMVPNFLNLPFSLWGLGAPKDVVGLAMYVSSRTAGCPYCSAHTCSFALRRGATPAKVAGALDGDGEYSAEERAAVAVARALSSVPASLGAAEREELARRFSPADTEWIVCSIAMMGFLNKFMDAIGVELEESTVSEVSSVIAPSGWTPGKHLGPTAALTEAPPPGADTLPTKLGVMRYAPSALSLDRQWTAGVPNQWPAVGTYLRERTGHDFPVLSRLQHGRPIRAIAVMVRDNLDPATSVVGLRTKCLVGIVFARVAEDAALEAEVRLLAEHNDVAPDLVEHAATLGTQSPPLGRSGDQPDAIGAEDPELRAALLLARAASPSPAEVTPDVIDACSSSGLAPAAIVEIVVWLSVLQLLHRLSVFYAG